MINKKVKYAVFIFSITIFICFNLFSNDTKTDTDNTSDSEKDKYLEILNYGIESEIVGMLKDLSNTPPEIFYPLLEERYKEASLNDTKIAFARFFSQCENLPQTIIDLLYNDATSDSVSVGLECAIFNFFGKVGGKREGLFLIKKLDDTNTTIQNAAADALSKMTNSDLIKPILDRLKEADEDNEKYLSTDIKSKLILSFGEMKAKEAVDYLKKIIDENISEKISIMYAMVSLAKIGDISSIDIIAKKLTSDDKKIQEYAGYSLSLYEDSKILSILKNMLKHNNPKVRLFALQGIFNNKDESALRIVLYKYKRDPSVKVKDEALKTLLYFGDKGISLLKKEVGDKKFSDYDLYVIATAVAKKPTEENVKFLIELYNNEDEKKDKNRRTVIAKGAVTTTSNVMDPMIKLILQSDDYALRLGGLKCVHQIKDSSLWDKVKDMSQNDPSPIVKQTAKQYYGLHNM